MDSVSIWKQILLTLLLVCLSILLPLAVLLVIAYFYALRNRSKVVDIASQLRDDQFKGRTVLLTGGSSGIGMECAVQLASRGATVWLLGRSLDRGEEAVREIRNRTQNGRLLVRQLDLSSLIQVARFCDQFCAEESNAQIDILVNNAGVFSPPYSRTVEGLDPSLASNHLGHYLLTCLLMVRGRLSTNAKLILVTGAMYKDGCRDAAAWNQLPACEADYSGLQAYRNSKLAICLFGLALHRHLRATDSGAKVFLVHPGVVGTNISRHLLLGLPNFVRSCVLKVAESFMLNSFEGCQGILACSADQDSSLPSGAYFQSCQIEAWEEFVLNEDLALAACRESARLVCDCLKDGRIAEELRRCGINGGEN